MSRASLITVVLLALPGCFDHCPYRVDGIEVQATSSARFDVANATAAEVALADMGFATERDGLWVAGEMDGLHVRATLDAGQTAVRAWVDLGGQGFRTLEAARAFVRSNEAAAWGRINATLDELEARVAWPPLERSRAEGLVSVC